MDCTNRSIDQALRKWSKDFNSKVLTKAYFQHKAPAYGNIIDLLLLAEVKSRIEAGLPVDDTSLRLLLVGLLEENGKSYLLVENNGKFSFEHGWACRFWKRHKLVSRVVTTKMRILPANFGILEETYIEVAAIEYQVPPDLVYGQDETNAQFVSILGEVIHLDKDRAFSAFRDPENSDSDYSDVKESEDSSGI